MKILEAPIPSIATATGIIKSNLEEKTAIQRLSLNNELIRICCNYGDKEYCGEPVTINTHQAGDAEYIHITFSLSTITMVLSNKQLTNNMEKILTVESSILPSINAAIGPNIECVSITSLHGNADVGDAEINNLYLIANTDKTNALTLVQDAFRRGFQFIQRDEPKKIKQLLAQYKSSGVVNQTCSTRRQGLGKHFNSQVSLHLYIASNNSYRVFKIKWFRNGKLQIPGIMPLSNSTDNPFDGIGLLHNALYRVALMYDKSATLHISTINTGNFKCYVKQSISDNHIFDIDMFATILEQYHRDLLPIIREFTTYDTINKHNMDKKTIDGAAELLEKYRSTIFIGIPQRSNGLSFEMNVGIPCGMQIMCNNNMKSIWVMAAEELNKTTASAIVIAKSPTVKIFPSGKINIDVCPIINYMVLITTLDTIISSVDSLFIPYSC